MEKVWRTIESPLWAQVRDFLTPEDVLHMEHSQIVQSVRRIIILLEERR